MILRVQHCTEYNYALTVRSNTNEVRLQPPSTPWQTRGFSMLKVLPATRLRHFQDFQRNEVHQFEIEEPHQRMVIDAQSTVTTFPRGEGVPPVISFTTLDSCRELEDVAFYLGVSRYVTTSPEIWRGAVDLRDGSDDLYETVMRICCHIYDTCVYQAGVTTVDTTSAELFETRVGVCQDFAHLMLAHCRTLLIPARYVSGYLYDASRGNLRGAHLSHAWVEVYLPGAGWVGFDPTNRQAVNDCYITLAVGRDYEDAAPVKGTYAGASSRTMNVSISIERIG